MTTFTPAQTAYRFYADGTETGSTALGGAATQPLFADVSSDLNCSLRIRIQNNASAAGATTDDWQLQFSKDNGTTWTSITTSTSSVKGFNSASLTDAAVTTNRLGAGSGSFVAGEIAETGLVTDRQLTASNFTELLYSLTIVAADNVQNECIQFRTLLNGATLAGGYTVTPEIHTQKNAPGDVLGILSGSTASITNPMPANVGGAFTVSVDDLIVAAIAEQTTITATAVTDNLGNTYSAVSAGVDAGTATQRVFYSTVTTGGSVTAVNFTATASGNDAAVIAFGVKGPFRATATVLDAAPAPDTTDVTSPFTFPATGTLAQADEAVVTFFSFLTGAPTIPTSPQTLIIRVSPSANIGLAAGIQVVSSTSTVTPQWTAGVNPSQVVLGTYSFERLTAQAQSGAATFGGQGSLSVDVRLRNIGAAQFSGTGNLSANAATVIAPKFGSVSFAGAGSFRSDGSIQHTYATVTWAQIRYVEAPVASNQISALFSGAGNLSVSGRLNALVSVNFAGAGNLSVDSQKSKLAAATFSGAGNLSVDSQNSKSVAATFAGTGNLSASGQTVKSGAATFAGIGNLQVTGGAVQQAAATFNGAGNLSADTRRTTTGAVTFNGAGSLSVDARRTTTGAATFNGTGNLSVDALKTTTGAITFSGTGNLSAQVTSREIAAAIFSGSGTFSINATIPTAASWAVVSWLQVRYVPSEGIQARPGAATFNGLGNLTVSVTQRDVAAATFNGVGNAQFSITSQQQAGTARFDGAGSFSVDTQKSKTAQATFAGAGTLSVDATQISGGVQQQIAATFAGAGNLQVLVSLTDQIAATFGGVGSFTASVTARLSTIATFNGQGSLSCLVTANQVIAATFAGAGNLTAFATITGAVNAWPGDVRFNGTGNLSVLTTQGNAASVTFQGTGSLSAATLHAKAAFATFQGTGSLSVDAQNSKTAAATFAGVGSLSINATLAQQIAATFGGVGNFSIDVAKAGVTSGQSIFNGAGSLSVNVTQRHVQGATFNGASTLSVNAVQAGVQFAAATFSGTGNVSINTVQTHVQGATFSGVGSLSVDVVKLARQLQATFNGSGLLSVSTVLQPRFADATFNGAGNFSIQVQANYAASVRFTGTGNLLIAVAARNVVATQFNGVGNLSVEARLRGQIAARFQGIGNFSANPTLVLAGASFIQARFSGQGGMTVDMMQFGPRHVHSKRSVFSVEGPRRSASTETRGQPLPTKRTGT
jgi:hypothetical protein